MNIREFVYFSRRVDRIHSRLEAAGIVPGFERHLDRLSNVRMHCGRLDDATCHYTQRITISGNTFAFRDELKAAGYRWDAGKRYWWVKATPAAHNAKLELLARIVRALAA